MRFTQPVQFHTLIRQPCYQYFLFSVLGSHSTSTNSQPFGLDWMDLHKNENKQTSVCVFCCQSEASGGVSGPEGKHQGEARWLRLPQNFQEVPQQVMTPPVSVWCCVAPPCCTRTKLLDPTVQVSREGRRFFFFWGGGFTREDWWALVQQNNMEFDVGENVGELHTPNPSLWFYDVNKPCWTAPAGTPFWPKSPGRRGEGMKNKGSFICWGLSTWTRISSSSDAPRSSLKHPSR